MIFSLPSKQNIPSLGARELRESNMLSLDVETGPYPTPEPLMKKFDLPKPQKKQNGKKTILSLASDLAVAP